MGELDDDGSYPGEVTLHGRLRLPRDGRLDDAFPIQKAYGADILTLSLVDTGGDSRPGKASGIGPSSVHWTSHFVRFNEPSSTYAHELGHNFGGDHNRESASNPETHSTRYNFGYFYRPEGESFDRGTFMSYKGQGRLCLYSNPDVLHYDQEVNEVFPVGVAYPDPDPLDGKEPADNARVFNELATCVAAQEPRKTVPPSFLLVLTNDGSQSVLRVKSPFLEQSEIIATSVPFGSRNYLVAIDSETAVVFFYSVIGGLDQAYEIDLSTGTATHLVDFGSCGIGGYGIFCGPNHLYGNGSVDASENVIISRILVEEGLGPLAPPILPCDPASGDVIRIDRSTGTLAVVSAGGMLCFPRGEAVIPDRGIFLAESCWPSTPATQGPPGTSYSCGAGGIVHIDPATGSQTMHSTGGLLAQPFLLTATHDGDLLAVSYSTGAASVVRVDADDGSQSLVWTYSGPQPAAIATDARGRIYLGIDSPGTGDGSVVRFDPVTQSESTVLEGSDFAGLSGISFPKPEFPECFDRADNDGDGLVDADDTGCVAPGDVSETANCSDGHDNDGDGNIDYPVDPGCNAASDSTEDNDCGDAIDNDGDGMVDFPDDPGCRNGQQSDENPACDDGIDNDGDGLVDYPADAGCLKSWNNHEEPECEDGLDNDGDGDIDYPTDIACNSATDLTEAPDCIDGIDNDGDGLIDFFGDLGCQDPNVFFRLREDPECEDGLDNDGDGDIDYPADSDCIGAYDILEAPDDGDGVADNLDNCPTVANPSQFDADLDGFGNACDGDFNQDRSVNGTDYLLFAAAYALGIAPPADPMFDMSGDGVPPAPINGSDLIRFGAQHARGAPGPSGLPCADATGATAPCTAP